LNGKGEEGMNDSTHVQSTRIQVGDRTDTPATAGCNQGRSTRCAKIVAAHLTLDDVPAGAGATQTAGDTQPAGAYRRGRPRTEEAARRKHGSFVHTRMLRASHLDILKVSLLALSFISAGATVRVQSQAMPSDEGGGDDTTALAKKLQNPIGTLYSVSFQNNTNFDYGHAPWHAGHSEYPTGHSDPHQ
jgi:hypothetical protein